jgi:hypothetical protein
MGTKIASLYAEIGADTSKLEAGLTKTKAGLTSTASATGGLKDMMSGLGLSLPTLGFAALGAGVAAAGKFIMDSVKDVTAYNREIGILSKNLSLSADETARIIQVADDFGISMGSVTTALQFATKNGFAPSVENLAKLADRMATIQDPTQRAAELVKIFGRNWDELTPLLNAGGDAIRSGAAAIEDGLIPTEAAIQKSRELFIAQDKLNDSWTALKNKVGNEVTPALIQVVDALNNWGKIITVQDPIIQKIAAAYDTYADALKAVADYGAKNTVAVEIMTEADWKNARATQAMVDKTKLGSKEIDGWTSSLRVVTPYVYEFASSIRDTDHALRDENNEMRLVNEAAQKLADEGFKQLQYAMAGELDDAAKGFTERMGELGTNTRILENKISELEKRKYLTGAQKQELSDLKAELKDIETARQNEKSAFDETSARIIFDLMQERLAVDGVIDTEDLAALTNYATKTGLIGEASVAASLLMQQAWIDAKGDAKLYGDKVLEIIGFIKSIPTDVNVDMWIKIHQDVIAGNISPSGAPPGPGYVWDGHKWVKKGGASGMSMVVPPGYHNDSFPVFAQSGERVTITPAGATNTSGGGSNTDAALLAAILNLPANISRAVRDGIVRVAG